ncbi:MAG TPA: ATP-binding protein [Pseudolabrys sp.]|nr:ATP-binding protein [Pseudolabrys sp.]
MRRLYLQIYLTIIAILAIFAVAAMLAWRLTANDERFEDTFAFAGELASRALPPVDAPRQEQQHALDRLHARLHADLMLLAPDGAPLAAAGHPIPPPHLMPMRPSQPGWQMGPGGPAWRIKLNDGRMLVAHIGHPPFRPAPMLLASLAVVAIAVAIGAYPVARRLTRRIERLKSGVDSLGRGELSARIKVEGKDEIAALAESFNRSAARIEELVESNKMLLANCSHELRTPLTRIGMALALLGERVDTQKRDQIKADIGELDQLIDEILLATRLDTARVPERTETIDLLALAAEECARENVAVEGDPVMVRGERAYLRRMVRNLLDNARRHAEDSAPEVRVRRTADGQAELDVRDHGPGIPQAEREKIFAPFYRLAGSTESGKGSGLGLTLVRQIARHHGGDVECLASDTGGSLFRVRLPAVA